MTKTSPRFRISKKGYDRFEVDRVLSDYESQISDITKKLETYESQVKLAHEQLETLKTRYDDLVSKLSIREKAADEIARLALVEANSVIETANSNADLIVKEALSTAKILLTELSKMSLETNHAKEDIYSRINKLQTTLDNIELPKIPTLEWLNANNQNDK